MRSIITLANFRLRVTGLQLVKPDMELRYAIDVATGFEMGEFKNAPDQVRIAQEGLILRCLRS